MREACGCPVLLDFDGINGKFEGERSKSQEERCNKIISKQLRLSICVKTLQFRIRNNKVSESISCLYE